MFNIFLVSLIVVVKISYFTVFGVNLVAYISQNGLHGEIRFRQQNGSTVKIISMLETTLQYPDQIWSWGVYQFPIDYTDTDSRGRCDSSKIGKNIVTFDEDLGYLTLPGNESSTWTKDFQLTGDKGIWGKSLVLRNSDDRMRICATITTLDHNVEHLAEAKFLTSISGSVYFRWLASSNTEHSDTLIFSNLFHIQEDVNKPGLSPFTEHEWKIYVTDIFEHDHHRSEDNCNFLQLVFDPQGIGHGKAIGDIDNRVGKMKISTNPFKEQQRLMFRDEKLVLLPSDLTIPHRTLYLVIFDYKHPDNFLACARIRHVKPIYYKTFINTHGIKGEVAFTQRTKFDPTFINFTVASASNESELNVAYAKDIASFRINTLSPSPQKAGELDFCSSTGDVFNPQDIEKEKVPPPGYGTQDQYPIGDLSGKLQSRNKNYFHNYILPGSSSELNGIYWDVFLPLSGANSIFHRGLVLYRYNRTDPLNITEKEWGCNTIIYYERNGFYEKPVFTAQVLFRYPVVGRILFRQPKDEPWQDTAIIFEYIIHADGSMLNKTDSHRWAIHVDPPGKDFYNWTGRCLSTGDVYNPYKVYYTPNSPDKTCKPSVPGSCRLGDLYNRMGTISIAGTRLESSRISRKMFIDSNLPLTGRHSILGKSLVIYDDFGPKARGERLACSIISGYYRRKVVAKEWYPNGYPLTVKGKLELVQQSEYEFTNIDVDLKGLVDTNEYHIHMTPVEANLAFPCEASTLYGRWNPRKVDEKFVPQPKSGSTDQYEMGDLSGKFGTLNGLTQLEEFYNDTNLPLFGYESIIGRSIVIHRKDKNLRWACSTLERGYSPNEAREIRAIASFHHPSGFAYGYMKFSQLIHNDGSQSDTVIEVKLRHPGKNDRNLTRNHNWQIFVNPVGVDATVKQTVTRCVAGGYVWNPYFTQLADPLNTELYKMECAPDNPLRCYVGDVSTRIGTIDLGAERVVLTDSNFPLEGQVSALGRSIVIFGPERSWERFACANIEPDHNIIKYVNLKKPPRFVVTQFLEELRSLMGIPEWMLDVDARKTKTLHGGACIQMIMHFKGPIAHQLEFDFSRLLSAGRLDAPSLYIPGYVNSKRKTTISYRTCGVRDPNEKTTKKYVKSSGETASDVKLAVFLIIVGVNIMGKYLYI